MITRFSTLYVGHIELEQCGHAGIPADDRRYSNARLAETFDTGGSVVVGTLTELVRQGFLVTCLRAP